MAFHSKAPKQDLTPSSEGVDRLLYEAWSVIANAGDWRLSSKQEREWVQAAECWRDRWHAYLDWAHQNT